MKRQLSYTTYAKYYDLIYHWKNYQKESGELKKLIHRYQPQARTLLDVACGTGGHLQYLVWDFDCTGVDISKEFLALAKKKVPRAKFAYADMTGFDLKKQFDVVTCLFSAIGFLKTYANLGKAIKSMALHLKPGGLLLIEPWFTKKTYKIGRVSMDTYDSQNLKIARLSHAKARGLLSILDMRHLVAETGKGVISFEDRYELAMFEPKKFLGLMKKSGLGARFVKNWRLARGGLGSRGLYIGRKPKGPINRQATVPL